MSLVDPDAALEVLEEFLSAIRHDHELWNAAASRVTSTERIYELLPLVRDIAAAVAPSSLEMLCEKFPSLWQGAGLPWEWGSAQKAAMQIVSVVKHRELREQILGPAVPPGPSLAASRLHKWVWDAVKHLWDDGHYGPAVHEAAKAVELQTQLKIDRQDLDGKDLYAKAFTKDDPKPGAPRLRLQHVDQVKQPKRWKSAHEGAQHLGMACAQGVRNPRAHGAEGISEQEAIEQLAVLSVLARWVDASDTVHDRGANS